MNELDEKRKANLEINRASLAEQVISNSIYQEAMTMMEADCFSAFESSKQSDDKRWGNIWAQLNAVKLFQSKIEYYMEKGAYAKQTLTALERVKKTVGL